MFVAPADRRGRARAVAAAGVVLGLAFVLYLALVIAALVVPTVPAQLPSFTYTSPPYTPPPVEKAVGK